MARRMLSPVVHAPLEAGVRQDHGQLVAAVAGGDVGGAARAADHLGHRLEHAVAELVAVGVVDRLEVVDVDQRERRSGGRSGSCAGPRAGAPPGSGGGWRARSARRRVACAPQLVVQGRVLDRERRLLGQVAEQRLLLLRERPPAAGDHDQHLAARRRSAAGPSRRARRARRPAARRSAGRRARRPRRRRGRRRRVLDRPLARFTPPEVGAERLDRRAQPDVDQRRAVELGAEGLADPVDRAGRAGRAPR